MTTSVSLIDLCLPIVLSAVAVFLVSNVIHMVLKYHASDYGKLPSEDQVMEALRTFNIPPGDYMMPRPAGMADMKSPAFAEKMRKGPVMIATFSKGGMSNMGQKLVSWFIFSLVVSFFSAYVTSRVLPVGTDYLKVFQIAGCTTFMAYGLAEWPHSIWYNKSIGTTIRMNIDALLYACATGALFGWLWPR
jgi:hypothetical protein